MVGSAARRVQTTFGLVDKQIIRQKRGIIIFVSGRGRGEKGRRSRGEGRAISKKIFKKKKAPQTSCKAGYSKEIEANREILLHMPTMKIIIIIFIRRLPHKEAL